MSLSSVVDLRSLTTFAPGPPRRWVGVRAGVAMGLPLVGFMVAGHGTVGFLASLGGFSVIYGAGTAVRRRAWIITGVGAGLWLASLGGVLTAAVDYGRTEAEQRAVERVLTGG